MITTQTKSFSGGMNQDINVKFQPENTYRYAMNAVLESQAGDLGSIINELGNQNCASVPTGYTVIGAVNLEDTSIVLFSTDNTNSEIGIYDSSTCTYTTWVNNECLSFNTAYPIIALFRIARGCDRIVYFTDGVNPYRSVNLDDFTSYLDEEGGQFDCNQLDFKRSLKVPKITPSEVNDAGGDLKVGAYQFAVRYLDQDLNPTNWFYVTSPVNIYDDAIASDYASINGAINQIDVDGTEVLGGALPTTKSINLELTNLDIDFEYLQIAVVAATEGTSNVNEVFILPRVAIQGQTQDYLYSGSNINGIVQGVIDDIIVDDFIPYIVEAHAQLENRLYLGGHKSETIQWSKLQQAANDITTNWVTNPITPFQQSVEGNSKNPVTPATVKSFPGDEILALGIEYLFDTGEWSPTMTIPGRTKIAGEDDQLLTFAAAHDDIQHLPLEDGQTQYTFEKWEVYNTAVADGTMGYYEVDQKYPDSLDCDGTRVYPEGNIRHHRMPCRTLVPIYTTDNVSFVALNFLGLSFSNVTYPLSNIVGHRFVYSKRDISNTTVLDTGILTGANPTSTDKSLFDQMPFGVESSETVVSFISPKTLLGKPQNGSYFKMLGSLQTSPTTDNPTRHIYPVDDNNSEFEIYTTFYEYINTPIDPSSSTENRSYSARLKIQPRTIQQATSAFTLPIHNESYSNAWSIFKLINPTSSQTGLIQVANKKYLKPYSNLETIQYVPAHNSYLTLNDSQQVFGGDCYISELRVMDIWEAGQEGILTGGLFERDYQISANFLNRTWVESQINYELLHPGDDTCNSIYISGRRFGDYLINKVATQATTGEWDPRDTICPEYYAYNDDYSKVNLEESSFSLASTFDFCDGCINEFPNRIYVSEKSDSTQLSDNYRYFRANNFTDNIDGSKGQLKVMYTDKDKLYALTTNGAYFIPTSQQRLTTDESNVYVGAADIFSIPARLLNTSDGSYAGCVDKLSVVSSEYGTFYVDTESAKVFHMSDKMAEISNEGMRNYLANNLNYEFKEYFTRAFSSEYPLVSPTDINGVGITATYDPRYRRFIFTKKDYLPLNSEILNWEPTLKRFYTLEGAGGNRKYVNLTDPAYFQNKSFTLSYSLPNKKWASFHSYLPNFLYRSKTTFHSSIFADAKIWDHNKGDYQTYYGQKKDHIIDFAFSKDFYQTKYFNTMKIVSDVFDVTGSRQINSFFDRMVAYNSFQSTGLQTLAVKNNQLPFSNVDETASTVTFANRADSHWNISELRDWSLNHSVNLFTDDWTATQSEYFIDKVVDPNQIDTNKSLFDLSKLKDQYAQVRFYFNPTANHKIVTDIASTFNKVSYRG